MKEHPGTSSSQTRRGVIPVRSVLWALLVTCLAYIFLFKSNDDYLITTLFTLPDGPTCLREVYEKRDVEYPPLSIAWLAIAHQAAVALPASESALAGLRPYQWPDVIRRFKIAHRLQVVLTALLTFALLIRMVPHCFPEQSRWEHVERLIAFPLVLLALGPLALDRLDLPQGALMLIALALLVSRAHWAWSMLALAVAINFKIAPVVMTPIWVLGTLTERTITELGSLHGWGRLLRAACQRAAVLAIMVVAIFAPFYALYGKGCLYFFSYHRDRGIEFESTYASLLGVCKLFGHAVRGVSSFGSCDLQSTLSPALTQGAPVITGTLLFGATLLLVALLARLEIRPREQRGPAATLAQRHSTVILAHMLLFLLLFLLGNKVFSPQFLLWLAPLAPLVPFKGWPRRAFLAILIGTFLLTKQMWPGYSKELTGVWVVASPPYTNGPTAFGTALLLCRNLLLLGMAAWLVVGLVRQWRQAGHETGLAEFKDAASLHPVRQPPIAA